MPKSFRYWSVMVPRKVCFCDHLIFLNSQVFFFFFSSIVLLCVVCGFRVLLLIFEVLAQPREAAAPSLATDSVAHSCPPRLLTADAREERNTEGRAPLQPFLSPNGKGQPKAKGVLVFVENSLSSSGWVQHGCNSVGLSQTNAQKCHFFLIRPPHPPTTKCTFNGGEQW